MRDREDFFVDLVDLDSELEHLKEQYPQQFSDAQRVVEEFRRIIRGEHTPGQQALLNLHLKKYGDEGYDTFARALVLDSEIGVILAKYDPEYHRAPQKEKRAFAKAYLLMHARRVISAATAANEKFNW